MNKIESDWNNFNGIGEGDGTSTLPIQTLPKNSKTEKWKKACMDALEQEGLKQLNKNINFAQYRQMISGEFTYSAVMLEETDLPWFNEHVRKRRSEAGISTYLRHFDFIGIIVKTLEGIYADFEDRFIVDSRDEYSTNEYIRQKTEMLHQYAQKAFMQEVNKLLLMRGVDPYKEDFQTEEEAQAYQQQLQQEIQSLTPPEIERSLSKNFKVLATEWAENTINEDNQEFKIPSMDKENFIDYLLTGRYFKHFGVGYDNYYVERWKVEETFFSQDVNAQYPQEGEYAGNITEISPSNILNKFGHLMTKKQQDGVGNYWNQSKNYDGVGVRGDNIVSNPIDAIFPENKVVPFHNYYDHQAIVQLENASGIPLSKTTIKTEDGEETFDSWTPRLAGNDDFDTGIRSSYLRDDINVRTDAVRVTQAYWRSYKRLGILIYTDDSGSTSLELTTDDLLPEFLKDREIKKLNNISIQELQKALKEERLSEYVDTITYIYTPEVWRGIKIRGNGTTVKDDIYLDVRPLDYQIRGSRSNMFNILLPVAGLIGVGLAKKLMPYQQLHNICMNQNTELLEKELGVFFTFDITGLPSEYTEGTTAEALYDAREAIKDSGLLGLDLSRANTQGNNPNIFQRQDITFTQQIQNRWIWAQQYKQEALSQIGITQQMLGAPNTYTTAEGVKQGQQASYAILNPIFERFNEAKGKEMELHIAVAQFCQANGKDQTVMFRKGDGELKFLDILAEDGELFPLRWLGVTAITSSRDRKIAEQLKQFVINDNTVSKTYSDAIELLTNKSLVELKEVAENIEKKSKQALQEQRQFESQQLDKQLQANAEAKQADRDYELALQDKKDQAKLEQLEIQAYATVSARGVNDGSVYDRIEKAAQNTIANDFRSDEINLKNIDIQNKQDDRIQGRALDQQKLELKSEELRIKEKGIDKDKFVAIANKN